MDTCDSLCDVSEWKELHWGGIYGAEWLLRSRGREPQDCSPTPGQSIYKYLLHLEGGSLSPKQALLLSVLQELNQNGHDVSCLLTNNSLNIWDTFCAPCLENDWSRGNTIKAYLQSLEIFASFVEKGLLIWSNTLSETQWRATGQLQHHLLQYHQMVHQQTAAQSTTRLVYEAYTQVTPDYMTGLENSELARGTNPGICNGEILYLQEGVLTHQRLSVDNVPPAECQPTWPTGKCPSAALQTGCLLFGHKHMDVTCGSPGSSRDSPGRDAAQMDDHLCEIYKTTIPCWGRGTPVY